MTTPDRRALLRAAGAAALAIPAGAMAPRAAAPDLDAILRDPSSICRIGATAGGGAYAAPGPRRKLKLSFNANSICTVGAIVAVQRGFFARNNLDVELVNFGGSTDQLLEAIATGKSDAGIGMALRWLKPLEQGFDVRISTAIHGGCMRLFSQKGSGINTVADLRGKVLGVTDMGAPDKNFFGIVAAKLGLDPDKDITYRVFPGDLLGEALKRGDVQAITLGDPLAWILRERDDLHEIANNLSGEYADRACCILGIRGSLLREDRAAARAVTGALLETQDWVHANPDEAAAIFLTNARGTNAAQLAAMLRSHTHGDHPHGPVLSNQLAAYIEELKLVKVIRPNTNAQRLAARIYADVLSEAPA
ncbi:ABC transporter substrate-binding protein [Siccirubricoccus phaeus]|uniref:ABC transporter substrate-binding protein n=1 Tax=Siccirubricoccus phaeus TaxID=2595053 RepID=UPI0011F110A1|nr:ABC transporter substrate-binding protein [Siccirubricoccus phaeus]